MLTTRSGGLQTAVLDRALRSMEAALWQIEMDWRASWSQISNRMENELQPPEIYTAEVRLFPDGIALEERTSKSPIPVYYQGQDIELVDAATGKSRALTVTLCTIGKMNRTNEMPLRQVVFVKEKG